MKRLRKNHNDYQTLENRLLLTSDLSLSVDDGVLTIQGGDQDDAVYVRYFADNVLVRYGVRGIGLADGQQFPATSIERIEFYGDHGDDLFVNNTDLDSLAYGNNGDDLMRGGTGTDSLWGGLGDDNLAGRGGNDDLHGDSGNDWLDGGAGDDEVLGWTGHDTLRGGDGNDSLSGYTENDWMHGGDGDDILRGHEGDDRIFGGLGDDEVFGWLGDDKIYGGAGNDELYGDLGNDRIAGNEGSDYIKGDEGEDRLYGGEGNDKIFGSDGWDVVVGGHGNDELSGGEGRDGLHGNAGNDILYGDGGADWLNGHEGDDIIDGGTGHDRIAGGIGADLLGGSFNDDVYVDIDDLDVGNDPDSPFINEDGTDRSGQSLANGEWNVLRNFFESVHGVSDQFDDVGNGAYLPPINFESDALSRDLEVGDVATDQWAWWGIDVSASDSERSAVVDATSFQTSGLVVKNTADDTRGGTLVFDFDREVQLDQVGLLVPSGSEAIVRTWAYNGALISEAVFDGTGAQDLVDVNGAHVQKLTVELGTDGALTGIVFQENPV